MRMIDADALIEKYGSWYTEEGTEEGFIGTLKSLIDEQPTVGGWISVADGLPERKDYVLNSGITKDSSEYVLVCMDTDSPYARRFVTIARYDYDSGYPGWVVRSAHKATVTHWMPMPELPKQNLVDNSKL